MSAIDPDVSEWDAWRPEDLARLLDGVRVPWYVAAGWALELFRGEQRPEHEDLELAVPNTRFDEVAEVLTPAVEELWNPEIRRELLFTSARWPEGLLVDGIPIGDRVLWGMTLRLLDDVVPRLLAGEWEDELG